MRNRRSVRPRSRRPAPPAAASCGTGTLSPALRVSVFVVIVVVVVTLLKTGQTLLDALGLVAVAAGAAMQISSYLGQPSASPAGAA
ncbi:hypothetical protein QNO07_26685 [Streptomyces sp. 549]|uniref:hypothetical protein n=1 Tax=Streptomyces sp. 549 TaxID=3049076 RepID=UPI0024C40431|nr:hypothetical protein [Streptomyces sp. 549]MDK1476941.1 hypothetical protein [Streptomyces sp. 549]